jgi:hypothetical protein
MDDKKGLADRFAKELDEIYVNPSRALPYKELLRMYDKTDSPAVKSEILRRLELEEWEHDALQKWKKHYSEAEEKLAALQARYDAMVAEAEHFTGTLWPAEVNIAANAILAAGKEGG